MNDLAGLLDELKGADFEAWKDIRFHLINIFSVNELEDINLRSPILQNAYSDIIQGCIQRAVATNGWHWLLDDGDPSIGDGKFEADIFNAGFSGVVSHVRRDTPAAAILAAYIETRKAMR